VGTLTRALTLAREPVRLTLRFWELGLSGAVAVVRGGLELLDPERAEPTVTDERYPPPPPRGAGNGGGPEVVNAEPIAPADSPPAVPDELIPDHVDEEVVLVSETAEEGAEEGAGAELHIDEPWDGYDHMNAHEIGDRLAAGTPELAAAVELYESAGKGRSMVLQAAERALKS
jgi:hypothetical protein